MIDPLTLMRGAHFATTVLAVGTIAFMALVADPAASRLSGALPPGYAMLRRRLISLTWLALAATILSGALWLLLVAANILDVPLADVLQGGIGAVITDTRFGQIACARLALALLLCLLMGWPTARPLPVLRLATAGGMIGLLAWVGHAGATPGLTSALHLTADVAHLLAAGAWLGGLPAFAALLAWAQGQSENEPTWGRLATVATSRFSWLGIASVGTLLASGLINSWELLGSPGNLLTTAYGQVLFVKIGLFAAMVAIAAMNRYRLTPRLPAPAALHALCRNSLAETALGLAVLFLVGTLGTMVPSAHVFAVPPNVPPDAAFVHIHTEKAMAEVTLDPGRPGIANASIRLLREDISILPAKYVRLSLIPPEPGYPTITHTAVPMADGTWRASGFKIAVPGIWTARVIFETGDRVPGSTSEARLSSGSDAVQQRMLMTEPK